MRTDHYRPLACPIFPRKVFKSQPTKPSSELPSFRRTWKIVRSEIALDIEPPTSNDGACTIMSLPRTHTTTTTTTTTSNTIHRPSVIKRYPLTPQEVSCVVWLDWRGYHARLTCIYNHLTDTYSRFLLDSDSIDPPITKGKVFSVDIRFYLGQKMATWRRVRDENGECYMVLNIAIDEGYGIRRGKAFGKFMGSGVENEEDVFMTAEEGNELGCLVGLKTVDEQRAMVERAREMKRLEGALRQVGERLRTLHDDLQQIREGEMHEASRYRSDMEEQSARTTFSNGNAHTGKQDEDLRVKYCVRTKEGR